MVSIYNPQATASFPDVRHFIEFKRDWVDPWQLIPFVRAQQVINEVAPGVGEAALVYDFGDIAREPWTAFVAQTALRFPGFYLRVLMLEPGGQVNPIWVGQIADDQLTSESPTSLSGAETIPCFELTNMLDRQHITKSKAIDNAEDLITINWTPSFNERNERGDQLLGNRSKSPGPDDVYVFDWSETTGREVWNYREMAEYLLEYWAPKRKKLNSPQDKEPFPWELTGQVDALEVLTGIVPQEGTLLGMFHRLIDRRNALTFYPWTTGQGSVELVIRTLPEIPITVGGKTLPANSLQVSFTVPQTYPYTHLVDDIIVRYSQLAEFDTLIVQGNRILSVFTLAYLDETLEEGWSTQLLTTYKNPGLSDPEKTDAVRSDETFTDIYRLHVMKSDFDGTVHQVNGGHSITVTPEDDGSIDVNTTSDFTTGGKLFSKTLGLEAGLDYSKSPPTSDIEGPPEERSAMAFMKSLNGQWFYIDRGPDIDAPPVRFSLWDKGLGVRTETSPAYLLAETHFVGADDGLQLPVIDYKTLLATVAVELDSRPFVKVEKLSANEHESERMLVITIDADVVNLVPDTVVGLDPASGDLLYSDANNRLIKDETDLLREVAAFLQDWYKTRQAITITVKRPMFGVPLGSLLTQINAAQFREPVLAAITKRSINFAEQITEFETGFADMDDLIHQFDKGSALRNG